MFTCEFKKQCIKDNNNLLKRIELPKCNKGVCHSGCHRYNYYHTKHFSQSLTPEVLTKIKEIDENTTHNSYLG
ncbi:MAG: hypothetical protein E7311_00645 [Clostridiales bacterium]|nr:hypothetical protein [Clostridiales bacterium]